MEPQMASACSSFSFVSQNCPRIGVGEAIKTLETVPLTPRKKSLYYKTSSIFLFGAESGYKNEDLKPVRSNSTCDE